MHIIVSLLAGIIFGAGLTISGMINPAKILNFLDFAAIPAGKWDASLGVVFISALMPMFIAYAIQRRQRRPIFRSEFKIPGNKRLTGKLILGSAMFGLGWGMVGLCPGPAVVALYLGNTHILGFFIAVLVGMSFNALIHSDDFKSKFKSSGKSAPKAAEPAKT